MANSENESILVRDMHPGEEALLVAMTIATFEKVSVAKNICDRFGDMNSHPWSDHKADHVMGDLAKADVVLVAEEAGAVMAFATLHYDRKYSTGIIGHLAVAAQKQGRGLGRTMVRAALERFRTEGLESARIAGLEQNERARALYESEGFIEVAREVILFRRL